MELDITDVFSYAGGDAAQCPKGLALWDEAMACYPGTDLPFLDKSVWQKSRMETGLPERLDAGFERVAKAVRKSEHLARLMWLVYYHYTRPTKEPKPQIACPQPQSLGDDKHLFYLLIAMSFVPKVWQYHQSLGIPRQITLDTIQKFREHSEEMYTMNFGCSGLNSPNLYWLSHYMHIPMFRLGRLEYWLFPSDTLHYVAYRRNSDGMLVVFPQPNQVFQDDGFYVDSTTPQNAHRWSSQLNDDGRFLTGTPVIPTGHARQSLFMQPSSEWKKVFQTGDYVVGMHIPFGGGLTPEKARESLAAVKPFFSKYFPQHPIAFAQCFSWILGSHLEQVLPENANLLKFHHELYLLPIEPVTLYDGMGFIFPQFDPQNVDLDKLPTDNPLRRKIVAFLKNGGHWRMGAMLYYLDDIATYGEKHYLTNWYNAKL